MKLRANTVKLSTVNSKLDKVFANGNVVVDSPKSGIVTGENGVYSVVPRTVLMTGNVVMKKGTTVMRGAQLTVNLITGQAVLGGGARTPGRSAPRAMAGCRASSTPNSGKGYLRLSWFFKHKQAWFLPMAEKMTEKSTELQQNSAESDGLRVVDGGKGLVVSRIGKSFNKRPVVRSVSLSLRRGEAVGLLGPNGAGKTTCFYMITRPGSPPTPAPSKSTAMTFTRKLPAGCIAARAAGRRLPAARKPPSSAA